MNNYTEYTIVIDGENYDTRVYGDSLDSPFDIKRNGKWVRAEEPIGMFHEIYAKEPEAKK